MDALRLDRLRKEYEQAGLDERDVSADPIAEVARWLQAAVDAGVPEPTAMTLATVGSDGAPSARVVLLKDLAPRGFTFFTSYRSHKGAELDGNGRAALCFFWPNLERQIRIEGTVSHLPRDESEAYFHSRPRNSQIGAWASRQSEVLASRQQLLDRVTELEARYANEVVPLPDFWGGYLVTPSLIELWQGRASRLHDRLRYRRVSPTSPWILERLNP